MTVYITQEVLQSTPDGLRSRYDFTKAMRYGDLSVLVPGNLNLVSSVPLVRALKEKLAKFSDSDYLLAVGDPSIIAVASSIAAEVNHGKLRLLKWDRIQSDYIPVDIDLSGRAL